MIPGGTNGQPVELQIVGVFHNVRGAGSREDYSEIVVPFWQSPWPQASMVVRTDGDPKSVIKSIAAAVSSVDPDLPLAGVRTVDEIVSESLAIDRFSVVLFSSFGVLGLLLAGVGIYGVMAFTVAQRTQEFGVRMALGAQRSRVLSLVLKEGTILAVTERLSDWAALTSLVARCSRPCTELALWMLVRLAQSRVCCWSRHCWRVCYLPGEPAESNQSWRSGMSDEIFDF